MNHSSITPSMSMGFPPEFPESPVACHSLAALACR
jgi:hypothetical protein